MAKYQRPSSAVENYFAWEKQDASGYGCSKSHIRVAVDITDFTNPTTTGRAYVDQKTGATVLCSGVSLKIEDQVAILMEDTADGATGTWAIESDAFRVNLFKTDAPAAGDTLYWDATNERYTLTGTSNTKSAIALAAKLSTAQAAAIGLDNTTYDFILVRKIFS